MPLTGKIDDGFDAGGDVSAVERGNTDNDENPTDKYAAPEKSKGSDSLNKEEEKPKEKPKRRRTFPKSAPYSYSGGDEKDRYLITYADLITLLLGLFIILYAISKIDLQKYQQMTNIMGGVFGNKTVQAIPSNNGKNGTNRNGGVENSPMPELKSKLRSLIDTYNFGDSFSLEDNERGLTVRIQESIIFPSGSADLNPSFKEVLSRLAKIFKSIPNDIRVEGHTDNVPINTQLYPSNWHLSVSRALNTAYYLIHDSDLNPDKVSIVGYSEYRPIATNQTPQGRSKNRRVDIVIIKE
jgi:chemotaxis protein MotB